MTLDAYAKAKRKHPDRLVLLESGAMASFVCEDADAVSRLLGEPVSKSQAYDCRAVTFAKARIGEVSARLGALGLRLIGIRRETKPPRRWVEFSLETPSDISKFVFAHKVAFDDAISELRGGKAESEWTWFVFPRMTGEWDRDGHGLRTLRESRMVLERRPIGPNIRTAANMLLALDGASAEDVFGVVGAEHVKASASLFALTADKREDRELFGRILDRFFGGDVDKSILDPIKRETDEPRDDTPRIIVPFDYERFVHHDKG